MKTIRGKIITTFILCLIVAGMLTTLYYQNAFSLKRKIIAIERFDDLLNDVLELRRYEKNIILYNDPASLEEAKVYLGKARNDFSNLQGEIVEIVGTDESTGFSNHLVSYEQILDMTIASDGSDGRTLKEEHLRSEGKYLVDFTKNLIQKKRRKIDQTMKRVLTIPLAGVGFLVLLVLAIFRLLTTGILKPLQLLESATDKVAKDSFSPISYDKEKQDEITRLIASFNKMVAELDARQEQLMQSRKLASIGTLTSGIAHELNNPLNNISITAEALKQDYTSISPSEINEMTDDILTQADRASQVVKNLLEFSRTERPTFKDLDIREIIERTISLIKNQLIVTHIVIKKELAPDLPVIRGKRQDLQQAFVNILLNAIQAMPGGGTITVRLGSGPEGYLRIDILDTGVGINPEAIEHIFDPFYTTKASGQGTGLGLSIVYNIIRTHNGYIETKSEAGKGTHFSIFLPIHLHEENALDDNENRHC